MSIVIKGLNLPSNCNECYLMEDSGCIVTGYHWVTRGYIDMGFDPAEDRHKNCPIIELPESHGRLIDGDEAERRLRPRDFSQQPWLSRYDLKSLPTIVPGED